MSDRPAPRDAQSSRRGRRTRQATLVRAPASHDAVMRRPAPITWCRRFHTPAPRQINRRLRRRPATGPG